VNQDGIEGSQVIPDENAGYNACVTDIRLVHEGVMVMRITPDPGVRLIYEAGQYTVLGLGAWESRDDGFRPADPADNMLLRAYSYSCPMLDEDGRLATTENTPFAEFYIARISRASDEPPMLTPRLFALAPGDRIFIGPRAHGHYTIDPVRATDDVLFFATGTGEAPHNAMVAELLARGHVGRILGATCVRYRQDLAYLAAHRELERRFPNYRYVALTTREPENLDSSRTDFIGKQYLQDLVASGRLEEALGSRIDPGRTHAYLCGNPAMIGLPQHMHGEYIFPEPPGMAELLTQRGFQLDSPRAPGNIHYERFW
jgi:ferredoxin/flavodoxin---NADP+ reductase